MYTHSITKFSISTICVFSIFLSACQKDSNTNKDLAQIEQNKPIQLSSNTNADIQHDLTLLDQTSNDQAEEALTLQDEVMKAAQNNNKHDLNTVVKKMDAYVERFNEELDQLPLQSIEGQALKNKIKDSNRIGLALAQAGVKDLPDVKEITSLQKEAMALQQIILQDMQDLKTKIEMKAS